MMSMCDGTFKTNSRAPRSITTSQCQGFHVDLARCWTQIGRRRCRRRHRHHVLPFCLVSSSLRARGTLGRVSRRRAASALRRGGRPVVYRWAGGRASGWAHSGARSHTRSCALESIHDDDDADGGEGGTVGVAVGSRISW